MSGTEGLRGFAMNGYARVSRARKTLTLMMVTASLNIAGTGFNSLGLATLVSTGLATSTFAADAKDDRPPDQKVKTQQEIDALNNKIKQAQKKLSQLNTEASKTEQQIGEAQRALSANQAEQRKLAAAVKELQAALASTQEKITSTEQDLTQQKAWLAEQLADTYKYGDDNALKLVLSGQSPGDTARLLRYHQEIHQARESRIDDIKQQQQQLNELKAEQDQSRQSLKEKQAQVEKNLQQQTALRNTLKASQLSAQKSIASTGRELRSMQDRTKALETLLQELIVKEELAQASQPNDFKAMRGRLKPPLTGRTKDTFQQTRANGNTWRGIWIEPEKNATEVEVRSIADGHVVFSDWLLGYGLLTIIDHGQGYFSLYGHTQTLLRAPGDWIAANSPIAILRPAQMLDQPIKGLYFEIRENSQALNPMKWLQGQR